MIPLGLRKYTSVYEHNWLNHYYIVDFLNKWSKYSLGGRLVDIGCGNKPYKPIFAPHSSLHVGVDLISTNNNYQEIDVVCNAYQTCFANTSFDVVLCTEVLEHIEDPKQAIIEMNRILKDKGVVILTVPLFWPIHEAPRDFYRYTEHGLRFLFQQAGFEVIELRPLTGFIVTFSQLSIYYFMRFQRGFLLRGVGRIINFVIQYLALMLNKYDRSTEFTNLYGLVAKKKSDSIETGAF